MVVLVFMDRLVMAAGPDGTGNYNRAEELWIIILLFFFKDLKVSCVEKVFPLQ